MTLKEIIADICNECDKHKQRNYSEFFCGATSNVTRRGREHGATILYDLKLLKKEYVDQALTELSKLGFDTGKQIGNGQDDTLWIYVYQKSLITTEYLRREFRLSFEQRWYDEEHYTDAPDSEGIYICLACSKQLQNNKFQSHKLIYIGMTKDQGFKERIGQHINQDHSKWKDYYNPKEEQLVYAIAPMVTDVLQSIESALIYENQPDANSEYRSHYQGEYDEITVNCNDYYGGKLKQCITAKKQ